jgi:hypothetical protein
VIAELVAKAIFHSSILDRVLKAVFDYENGTITEDDARAELDRIDVEIETTKRSHWDIVNKGVVPVDDSDFG